jgi:GGDEF domain-containing protein
MEDHPSRTDVAHGRRAEDRAEPVSHLALQWLREVIETEFTPAAARGAVSAAGSENSRIGGIPRAGRLHASGRWESRPWNDPLGVAARFRGGDVDEALWRREWHRRWKRLQLPLQFSKFSRLLCRADRAETVYALLAEHATRMVGGHTCLIFLPRPGAPLRPLPNAELAVDASRLVLGAPPAEAGDVGREEVLGSGTGPFAGLRPLLTDGGAVSLAYAPFGAGGAVVLVERRAERHFGVADHDLLNALVAQANGALARLDVARRSAVLPAPSDGLPHSGDGEADAVLDHALAIAERGVSLVVARLRLDGLARIVVQDGAEAADRVHVTAAEVLREMAGSLGMLLHEGEGAFLLVLPRIAPAHVERAIERLRRQLPARVSVRAGVARYEPGDGVDDLLARTQHLLDAAAGGNATAPTRRTPGSALAPIPDAGGTPGPIS